MRHTKPTTRLSKFALAAAIAIAICLVASTARADAPSMPAANPNFQALRVHFGPFKCVFAIKDKTYHLTGVTELSQDGRRAVTHDPDNVYFQNQWYDAQRKIWIKTSIFTFLGLDFSATSPGWSGGQLEFDGLVSMGSNSLPFRAISTPLSGGLTKTVEQMQEGDGNWHTLDTQVCGQA
jgi:hypothetical protein